MKKQNKPPGGRSTEGKAAKGKHPNLRDMPTRKDAKGGGRPTLDVKDSHDRYA